MRKFAARKFVARKFAGAVVGALVAVTLAAGVSGAAEADKSSDEILADASAAMQRAKSVALKGTVVTDDSRITLNLVAGHGKGGGTMFLNGAKFAIVLDAPDVYLRAGKAAWTKLTGSESLGQLVGGRWMKVTTDDENYRPLANLADLDQLGELVAQPDGVVTKGATTRFQGKAAIPLQDSGTDGDGEGTLYIAAKGAAYPLGIVSGAGEGQLTFSQYNTAKIPRPPSNAIDASELATPTT